MINRYLDASMLVLAMVLAISTTACLGAKHYRDAAQLERAAQSWSVLGKTQAVAINTLAAQGFSCERLICAREVSGLYDCAQKQQLQLQLGGDGLVVAVNAWQLPDGRLPNSCA